MANPHYANEFYDKAARAQVSATIVSKKANVCPFAIRLGWHAAGTFDVTDNSGGSDGATMRFEPEISDPANAGLGTYL
jgi:catalase (peroxidase I)